MGLRRWVVKRVVAHRLRRFIEETVGMTAALKWLQGKKTIIVTLVGSVVALLEYFQQAEVAAQVKAVGDAIATADPKLMLLALAGFVAWLFDKVGRNRQHAEVLKALKEK